MIETQEQYERAKIVARTVSGPTLGQAIETIEVLRKVTRMAEVLVEVVETNEPAPYWDAHNDLREMLKGIPDWITQE